MVTYSCELCGFSSVYSTRYRDHCMTRKHLRNLDTFEKEKNMVCQKKNQQNVSKNYPELSKNYPELSKNYPELSKNFWIILDNFWIILDNFWIILDNFWIHFVDFFFDKPYFSPFQTYLDSLNAFESYNDHDNV